MKKLVLALAVVVGLLGTRAYAESNYSLRGASLWIEDAKGICLGTAFRVELPFSNAYLKPLGIDLAVVKKDAVYGCLGLGMAPSDMVDISAGVVANKDTGNSSYYIGATLNIELAQKLWEVVSTAVGATLAEASALGEK